MHKPRELFNWSDYKDAKYEKSHKFSVVYSFGDINTFFKNVYPVAMQFIISFLFKKKAPISPCKTLQKFVFQKSSAFMSYLMQNDFNKAL